MTSEALQNRYFVRLYCKNIDKTHSLAEPNDKIQFHVNYFFKKKGPPPPRPLNPPLAKLVVGHKCTRAFIEHYSEKQNGSELIINIVVIITAPDICEKTAFTFLPIKP